MEILKDTVPTVVFYHPTGDNTTSVTSATWSKDGTVQIGNLTLNVLDDRTEAKLPYQPEEAAVEVTWNFSISGSGSFSKTENFNVVTPLVTPRWLKDNLMEGSTDEEIREAEAAVRYIINAHTGQSFGKHSGTKLVTGNNTRLLRLPARAISISTLDSNPLPSSIAIKNDGWTLDLEPMAIPPIRSDFYGYNEQTANGVITAPGYSAYGVFTSAHTFVLAGEWGWPDVPGAVREAAIILASDYASLDSIYRDRYLTSLTSPDWRIQYHAGAFARTGNVRADQLLADYVMGREWVVI